jgi:Flp pilus assembly pilin Flp
MVVPGRMRMWQGAAQAFSLRHATLRRQGGQTMTEYALMLSVIALAVAVAYDSYGGSLNSLSGGIGTLIGGIVSSIGG